MKQEISELQQKNIELKIKNEHLILTTFEHEYPKAVKEKNQLMITALADSLKAISH
ncbi:hypothetical protein [Lactiplantibacillus mudanjiangensis]|uniref:Uncharacterized protein n=1 Tax=Lactiplantibacillus mudanjiangensis TaxID=1296538 RepID=A0A660E1I5_9LACO|nr:hypothetical protein [Lactiplantibacillus mudanjiangensis]VDG25731.1 hypothetical protein MUDAN_IGPPGNFN_03406 [Lactiplantibacillus mudanjiangensis]VDG27906.1 hypothetical protein MUDAN_MDHGFNIF_02723 [Lactiplantibacillus mudanjiangensis]